MAGKRKQPVIGITPSFDEASKLPLSKETVYLRRTYTKILESVGAIPLILNAEMPLEYIMSLCDGIVISGGEDIDPELYGARETIFPKEPRDRAEWEFQLLRLCEKQHTPVLGVCYGMQLLAVYNGGALHQDIQTEIPNCVNHNRTNHEITFLEDFLGFSEGTTHTVESRHHQAVSMLPQNFRIAATAPDGVIEAMAGEGCWGIQWHPESDETGIHIYRAFVEHCMQ